MNPYPQPQSVLIMDNCCIHHMDALQEILNDAGASNSNYFLSSSYYIPGIMLLYLPPYSPDLNPIEESFSTCM